MDIATSLANTTTVQNALKIIATMLQITADMWPSQPNVPTDGSCYDVIVVGAGSAGAVVAARLAQRGLAVLLVEAGGDPPIEAILPGLVNYIPRTREDWNYTANCNGSCYKNCSMQLTRGKMLGGSSSANHMCYVRGNPRDYHQWSQIAQDSSWEWKNVLKYFKRSERLQDQKVLFSSNGIFRGTDGPILVGKQPNNKNQKYLEAFREIGQNIIIDYNGYDTLGYADTMFTIGHGVKQSTAYAFLQRDRVPPNLHVLRNTFVTRVLLDASNRAIGVKVIGSNGKLINIYASRRVILSAGAINTPQLLMLSGIGPAQHLKSLGIPIVADLPVGYNLQDHVATLLPFTTDKLTDEPPPSPSPSKFPAPMFFGFVTLNKTKSYPDYESQNLIMTADGILQFCSFFFNLEDDICQQLFNSANGYEIMFTVMTLLHPKSRGRVSLTSTNPTDPPLIELGLYSDESDLDTMANCIEDFINIANSSYFKSVDAQLIAPKPHCCVNSTYGTKEYWRCYAKCVAITQYHYTGTAPIGTVLDSRLRVRGVQRLFVADASAIPLIPSGNTNAPVIMIGEKAADIILEDLIRDLETNCKVNAKINKDCNNM